jgi:hypothetical protein
MRHGLLETIFLAKNGFISQTACLGFPWGCQAFPAVLHAVFQAFPSTERSGTFQARKGSQRNDDDARLWGIVSDVFK